MNGWLFNLSLKRRFEGREGAIRDERDSKAMMGLTSEGGYVFHKLTQCDSFVNLR